MPGASRSSSSSPCWGAAGTAAVAGVSRCRVGRARRALALCRHRGWLRLAMRTWIMQVQAQASPSQHSSAGNSGTPAMRARLQPLGDLIHQQTNKGHILRLGYQHVAALARRAVHGRQLGVPCSHCRTRRGTPWQGRRVKLATGPHRRRTRPWRCGLQILKPLTRAASRQVCLAVWAPRTHLACS